MSKNISPFENDFLFQNNSLPMSVINIRAEIIDINLKALDIFGYPKKEILKLTANDLIKDKDYELEIDRLNALFNKEINSYTIKRNYTNKSGENIPLNITVSLITDPVSKEKFFLGIFELLDSKIEYIYNNYDNLTTLIMDSPILQQIFNISTKKVLFENKKFLHYLSYTNEDFHHLNEKEFFESKLLFNKKAIIKREYYNRPVEFSILDKGNKENWFFL